jgi:ADP-heptose:LPS heptosyltransferase
MAHVLKHRFPTVQLSMLIQHYTSELVEDHRDVDRIIYYDENDRLIPLFKLASLLRKQKFDIVFHTHPQFRLALVTWLASVPLRIGTGYRPQSL